MNTITDRPPAGTRDLREAAMKFLARGDTAADLSARAADVRYAGRIAALCGITVAEAQADLDEIAEAVARLEAEHLTPADCRRLLGWSPELTARVLAEKAALAASGALSAA